MEGREVKGRGKGRREGRRDERRRKRGRNYDTDYKTMKIVTSLHGCMLGSEYHCNNAF